MTSNVFVGTLNFAQLQPRESCIVQSSSSFQKSWAGSKQKL